MHSNMLRSFPVSACWWCFPREGRISKMKRFTHLLLWGLPTLPLVRLVSKKKRPLNKATKQSRKAPQKWQVHLSRSTSYAKCMEIPLWLPFLTVLPPTVCPIWSGPSLIVPFPFNGLLFSPRCFLTHLFRWEWSNQNFWLGWDMYLQLRGTHSEFFKTARLCLGISLKACSKVCMVDALQRRACMKEWRQQLVSLPWQWKELYLNSENMTQNNC